MQNFLQIPKDLSPLERARLKLISHFVIIAVFNGIFACYAYLAQGNHFNWNLLLIIAASQGVIALCDALKKFYSAQADPTISTLIAYGSAQATKVAASAPPVVYTTQEQQLQQAFSNFIDADQKGVTAPVIAIPVK